MPVPGPLEIVLILGMSVLIAVPVAIPFWRIFSKAGFSGALSLLMLLPLVNLIMLYVLAFKEWPALRDRQ